MIEFLVALPMLALVAIPSLLDQYPERVVAMFPQPEPPTPAPVAYVRPPYVPRPARRARNKTAAELSPNEVAGVVYEEQQPDGSWKKIA